MTKRHQLVLVGDSVFAQVAYEYFMHDSEYEVVAFSVERAYLKRPTLFGLPVVPFETLPESHPPRDHHVYAALVFTQGNRLRTRLYRAAVAQGYAPASYLSSRAIVAATAQLGDHCFVCEDTVVHPHARVGDNVVLWSGNYVGAGAVVAANCFTLPHVVIDAGAVVGANCIIGANAALAAGATLPADSEVAAGAVLLPPGTEAQAGA